MDISMKRKRIEDTVLKTLKLMDPTGINANKYQTFFKSMSDEKFTKWIKDFLADDKSNIRLDIEEFGDGSRTLNLKILRKLLTSSALNYLSMYTYHMYHLTRTDP